MRRRRRRRRRERWRRRWRRRERDESAGGGEGAGSRRVVRAVAIRIVLGGRASYRSSAPPRGGEIPRRQRRRPRRRGEASRAPAQPRSRTTSTPTRSRTLTRPRAWASPASSINARRPRDAATTEVATTATAVEAYVVVLIVVSAEGRMGASLSSASAEDWPTSRLVSLSAESRGGDDSRLDRARARGGAERRRRRAIGVYGARSRPPRRFTATGAKLLKQEQSAKGTGGTQRSAETRAALPPRRRRGPSDPPPPIRRRVRRRRRAKPTRAPRARREPGRTRRDAGRRSNSSDLDRIRSIRIGIRLYRHRDRDPLLLSRDFAADATTTRRRIVYTLRRWRRPGRRRTPVGRTPGGSRLTRARGEQRDGAGTPRKAALGGRQTELRQSAAARPSSRWAPRDSRRVAHPSRDW